MKRRTRIHYTDRDTDTQTALINGTMANRMPSKPRAGICKLTFIDYSKVITS